MDAVDAAREVVGSLIDYKDGDGCPMCEAPVLTTTEVQLYYCTSCEWVAPYHLGLDPALRTIYERKLLDRLLPQLTFSMFPTRDQDPKVGTTVNFRKFQPFLVTDAN